MTRFITQSYHWLKAKQGRRIYIIPTRFGYLYAGFLLLILIGAINYNNSLGHILCFLLASVGWIGMHHSYRNIAKVQLIKCVGTPVFLGQKVVFNLQLTNSSKANSYQIEFTSHQHPISSINPFKNFSGYRFPVVSAIVEADKETSINYHIPSLSRGACSLGQLRISSQFPLGLFTAWTYFKTDCKSIVYPAPKGDLPFPVLSDHGQLSQDITSKGNDDFSALNNYRSGDPLKSIAWKALARDDVLRVKQFTGSQGGELLFSWTALTELRQSEARLSQLCQWIIMAEEAGLKYGLALPNIKIEIGSGHQHQKQCLTALALYPNE